MIYPNNFEIKIGFDDIRHILKGFCLSPLGKSMVDEMAFSADAAQINEWLQQVGEFRKIQEGTEEFPLENFYDLREQIARLKIAGTHLEEQELFDLKRSLQTVSQIVSFLRRNPNGEGLSAADYPFPALYRLTADILTFPEIVQAIDRILDKFGRIKDSASEELLRIRKELSRLQGSISHTLNSILRSAQSEGLVEKDITPTVRDGRLVIPVSPGLKRRISGIVHDESASGKTVFIEPTEVVEANNRIRELENDERKEVIRILKEIAAAIRPHWQEMLVSFGLLQHIDFIRAKAEFARHARATEPHVASQPLLDMIQARHPLLEQSLIAHGKQIVALDINLSVKEDGEKRGALPHILLISGPNAGGKSVCLKTVGLLQYMLQCGLSIPVSERSAVGVFNDIMIDIGDEQSIENDLSTYSSHLTNMKQMMRHASDRTLLLIDEFGTGTEPQIGGAIAQSVLHQFCRRKAWAVITTHYQNLKHFAKETPGVVNGAMLYDRSEMRPLFQLAIGRPGSSFAIEIARKTGLPEEVISEASELVGSDYIQSDKYLQDIVRDKRYWEAKRQTVHQREKEIERTIQRYESRLAEIEESRKEILARAKEQAENLLHETNRRIENTIKEIREAQAEREDTKRIREELRDYQQQVETTDSGLMSDDDFQRKLKQIAERKERREKRRKERAQQQQEAADRLKSAQQKQKEGMPLQPGDTVRIKGQTSVGTLERIDGTSAVALFGGMRTKLRLERLEHADPSALASQTKSSQTVYTPTESRMTRTTIDAHRSTFKQDLDVRGLRGDEAINQVQYFIDDAILVGVSRVRILHGKGNGILRQLIRQYLATVPNVVDSRDEHVQFGGAGITVVDLE